MKDEEMSCEELYYAYDLTENQQRKWLVKISRYWLEKSIDQEINKVVIETLDVVEKYIKGQATKEDLQNAASSATAAAPYTYAFPAAAAAITAARAASLSAADASAATVAADSSAAYAVYKELLLEVINEMDEFERTIRKKS